MNEEIKRDKRFHPRPRDGKTMYEKKQKVYEFLLQYIEDKGYSPTMQEICDATGIRSKSTASYYLNWLKADGIIDFVPNSTRTITFRR